MKPFAARAGALERSAIRVLFDAADARPDAIRLEVGEPSFSTPGHIIEAARRAASDGYTGYGPNGGLLTLRELLMDKIERVDGYQVGVDNVVVTPGGMNALYSTYLALLDPGDEVLLPSPGFPNMDGMVRLTGGSPRFYTLDPDRGHLPDPTGLEHLVSPRTKVIFINTPSNPTGAVFGHELMEDLVALARRHDLWLISDEVYDEMILEPEVKHTAAARFDDDGRVVGVYSFSKVYAMTGWRVGYAVCNPDLAATLRKLQEPQVSCPSTISQKAAEAALTGPREPIDAMRNAYVERRDVALQAAERAGIRIVPPQGTLYMLVDISAASMGSLEFALELLDRHGVSVAPGSVFGPAGEGWVRISLAAEAEAIEEGLARIATMLRERVGAPT